MLRTQRIATVVATTAGLLLTASAYAPAQGQTDASAPAQRASHLWDNCTNFNRTYHHGVGRRYAHDHTSGTPVRNFLHSNRKYRIAMNHNSDLDRDKDHIACEKA